MVSVRRVPDGDLVGVCTGHRRGDASAELAGLGVLPERRREGIGTRLVEQFEENAAEGGFERISVGSAGGDVDNFYAALGYEPESELVRLDAETLSRRRAGNARRGSYLHRAEVPGEGLKRWLRPGTAPCPVPSGRRRG